MMKENENRNTATTPPSTMLEKRGEHNINNCESSDDEAIIDGDKGQEDNPLNSEPNRDSRAHAHIGRLERPNSTLAHDPNSVETPSREAQFEALRMLQLNPSHNRQARRGTNPTRTSEHFRELLGQSNSTLDANSVVPPSMEVLFEAWRMQQQNTRNNDLLQTRSGRNLGTQDHRDEQPRQLPVDPMLRRAENIAFQNDRQFYDQHQQPPVIEVQGQNNTNVGNISVDETSRAITGAGRKAFSYRIAKQMQERHIRQRIQSTVKSRIFRKVKFITSTEYYERVMKVIVEQEKPADKAKFVRVYKTCVVGAVNTKRSACEQAAAEVVRKLLKDKNHLDEVAPAPYSVETLCKLRQSQTPEEKEAFRWFVGELLECVVGKAAWGKKKYQARISEAVYANTTEKIVTVSDEAFGLVLYENYIDKWITKYHNPSSQGERGKKILGKYTRSSVGYTEYGGWSEEGVLRFNELCSLVEEDRSSRNASEAEEQVMLSLRQQRFGEQSPNGVVNRNDQQSIIDSERSLERNVEIVNAYIEL